MEASINIIGRWRMRAIMALTRHHQHGAWRNGGRNALMKSPAAMNVCGGGMAAKQRQQQLWRHDRRKRAAEKAAAVGS